MPIENWPQEHKALPSAHCFQAVVLARTVLVTAKPHCKSRPSDQTLDPPMDCVKTRPMHTAHTPTCLF